MDYGKIITTGFKQAWKYKSLWILGFLVSGGNSFNTGSNWSSGDGDFGGLGNFGQYRIESFLQQYLPIILLVGLLLFFIVIIFWILNTIAIGGLIDAARCFKNNEEYRLGKSWSAGVKTFWPIFGLGLLNFIVIFSLVIILIGVGVGCFFIHIAIGIISLLFLIPLLIAIIFVAEVTVAIAKRMIVLDGKPVFDAIGDAVSLWKSKLGSTALYSLIYFGISIGIAIGTLVVMLPVIIPLIGVGIVNIWAALIIGIPVILAIALVVNGYTGASLHLMTTEFYFQLIGYEPPRAAYATSPPVGYPPVPPTDHDGNPLSPTPPADSTPPAPEMAPPEQQDYRSPTDHHGNALPPQSTDSPGSNGNDDDTEAQDDNRPPDVPRP